VSEPSFHQHSVTWTRENIGRFWDWWSARSEQASYFSKQAGETVLAFVGRHLSLSGMQALDYGCGAGHLTQMLATRGTFVHAVDFSATAVAQTCGRVGSHPNFGGAQVAEGFPLNFPAGSFDVVFALEVVEHLLPADREPTMAELSRVTRPGGHVILTTPNNEDLAAGEQLCPDCGCVFHRVQHLSSWNASSLSRVMNQHGFTAMVTKQLHIKPYARWPRLHDLIATVRKLEKPNLLYIGRRD
jgi:2-polyprenyl-3-methyl-5-hydroxy-6-metoxy-1,4-benzoquinol methylase